MPAYVIPPPAAAPRRAAWPRLLLLALALLALLLAGRRAAGLVLMAAQWVRSLGAWGAPTFIAGYVVATVLLLPGSLLTLCAGALFGLLRGTLYVLVGASLGATAACLVARHLARGAVERWIGGDPRVRAIDEAVGREGWRLVLLLRLSPAVPFNLLNYALGLTRVPLREVVLGSIGMLPGIVLYVYYGTLLRSLAELGSGAPAPRGAGHYVLLGLGLAATLVVTVLLTRAARRALAAQEQAGS